MSLILFFIDGLGKDDGLVGDDGAEVLLDRLLDALLMPLLVYDPLAL